MTYFKDSFYPSRRFQLFLPPPVVSPLHSWRKQKRGTKKKAVFQPVSPIDDGQDSTAGIKLFQERMLVAQLGRDRQRDHIYEILTRVACPTF
ncbi:hypothetical protein TNCT_192361 [Trichonephila clavata]|uniref:Uncharacterized protein n=1 Tax=Trichonephila clavata TaxID=2740835 RepID=A0A8X6H4Q3_TRICU|nr:hypothetical protein TNCT_192361 [Trichonephila clavata]